MGRSGRERQVCGRSRETAEVDRAYLNKTGSVGLRATDTADEGTAWTERKAQYHGTRDRPKKSENTPVNLNEPEVRTTR